MIEPGSTKPIVFNNWISDKVASFHNGYNVQHLRRLLRDGRLSGMKLGHTWLIDKRTFEVYLENANHTKDKRFGPVEISDGDLPSLLPEDHHTNRLVQPPHRLAIQRRQ